MCANMLIWVFWGLFGRLCSSLASHVSGYCDWLVSPTISSPNSSKIVISVGPLWSPVQETAWNPENMQKFKFLRYFMLFFVKRLPRKILRPVLASPDFTLQTSRRFKLPSSNIWTRICPMCNVAIVKKTWKNHFWPNIGPIVQKLQKNHKSNPYLHALKKIRGYHKQFFKQLCSIAFGPEVGAFFGTFWRFLSKKLQSAEKCEMKMAYFLVFIALPFIWDAPWASTTFRWCTSYLWQNRIIFWHFSTCLRQKSTKFCKKTFVTKYAKLKVVLCSLKCTLSRSSPTTGHCAMGARVCALWNFAPKNAKKWNFLSGRTSWIQILAEMNSWECPLSNHMHLVHVQFRAIFFPFGPCVGGGAFSACTGEEKGDKAVQGRGVEICADRKHLASDAQAPSERSGPIERSQCEERSSYTPSSPPNLKTRWAGCI